MARITYSGLVTEINGSIGGTTFQKNKYGYTIKNKPRMIHPQAPDQNTQKQYVAAAARAWGNLSSTVRSNWSSWVESFPQYSTHNSESELSGYIVFLKYYLFKCIIHQSTDFNIESLTFTLKENGTATPTVSLISGILKVSLNIDTVIDNWYTQISASQPTIATANFVGSSPRYMGYCTSQVGELDITDNYTTKYGTLPEVGQYVNIKIVTTYPSFPKFLGPFLFHCEVTE